MRSKYFILGAFFAFLGLGVHAQISEMLYQGFEADETVKYSGSPTDGVRSSSSVVLSGSRALKLVQQSSQDVEIIFDTLDFTGNLSLKYIALEFDHICPIPINSSSDINIGTIWWKRTNQTEWTKLSDQEYDKQDGAASTAFQSTGCFNENSYKSDWKGKGETNNDMWKHERFNLNNVLTSSLAAQDRKLQIKLVLKKRTLSSTLDTVNCAWWIDNLRVTSSAEQMINPKIKMWFYPHAEEFPNSRCARVQLDATTVVAAGINSDSVYLCYKVGSDPSINKVIMNHQSGSRYTAEIPFFGYDTAMSFYCLVRDATGNQNTATFPPAVNSWCDFHYIRGVAQPAIAGPGFTSTSNTKAYFFTTDADHRGQFVYDSALLAGAGYGPGSITKLKLVAGESSSEAETRKNFQIRMKNIPTDYVAGDDDLNSYYFDNSHMSVVYNDDYTLPVVSEGDTITINLQDTFFYAGRSVLVQVWYDDDVDHKAQSIRYIPALKNNSSCHTVGFPATMGAHAFVDADFVTGVAQNEIHRPLAVFYEEKNQPLYYDAGISELTTPNYYVAMEKNVGLLRVKMKNFGARTLNEVRISYQIDDTISGYYDWSGSLSAGSEQSVDVANIDNIAAGFHKLTVWVEDSVTSSNVLYRDHEPYNDTMYSEFIVCDGPMNGVKNIGGSNPHFNDIEEFLFSLNRCGIDDSLIVRLAPGNYPPFTMPTVTGLSEEHYIVFESQEETQAHLYADTSYKLGYIAGLDDVDNIRFRNLTFVRRGGELTNMIKMASSTVNCEVVNCSFIDSVSNPAGSMRISAMIDNNYATNLRIEGCTFIGGRIGVSVRGESNVNKSSDAIVNGNIFRNQSDNAARVEYMTNIEVNDNQMYDVLTNASSVLVLNSLDGNVSAQRNKIYVSHGASDITINSVNGTESNHALVANNMIVSNDDGQSAQMSNPVSILNSSYVDFVYNAVKLVAPMRLNIAAVSFGGSVSNSRFVNNIVATLDSTNYAFGYLPGAITSNIVNHNVYYSEGAVLNRYNGASYSSVYDWKYYAVPSDTGSISVPPNFLNASLVDLRTFSRQMKGKGTPIEGVTTDMFGNERSEESPCPGAFEFSALPYDFEPMALLEPTDNCYMPDQAELVFSIGNNGVDDYDGSTSDKILTIHWTINGTGSDSYDVSQIINAEDTVSISTGKMVHMPVNGTLDSVYVVKAWVTFEGDLNQTNDTSVFRVVSRYHPVAPDDRLDSLEYASRDTIVPTGLNEWSVYKNSSAPKWKSRVYWYQDSTSTEPFYVGDTLITDELRMDTAFYVRQRRDVPIVRITQVELFQVSNAAGLSSPMPYWMADLRKAALQFTNVGDAPANLKGDTLMMLGSTGAINNKVFTFDNDLILNPGKSIVVQYAASVVTDSSLTIHTNYSAFTMPSKPSIAFVYIHDGAVTDAVPFNDVFNSSLAVNWSSVNVPSYVWSSDAIAFDGNIAGVVRVAFDGKASDWSLSSDIPMSIAKVNKDWIMYEDGGCEGEAAVMRVGIIAPPEVELAVEKPILPPDGCAMGEEEVSVVINNYGTEDISSLQVHYTAGGDTVTESVADVVEAFSSIEYTFGQKLDLAFDRDSIVLVKVWITASDKDPVRQNDTNYAYVHSLYTPLPPDTTFTRYVKYATRDTVSIDVPVGLIPIWYDFDKNAVDTGNVHITELIYSSGTRGVGFLAIDTIHGQVGDTIETNTSQQLPSPYLPVSKNVKEQYIYTAHDLRVAGLKEGELSSIAFGINSIPGGGDLEFSNYSIAIDFIADSQFTSTSNWKTVSNVVYSRDVMTVSASEAGSWKTHEFDNKLYWDGESAIVVQIAYEVENTVSTGVKTYCFVKQYSSLFKNSNSSLNPSPSQYVGSGTRSNVVPSVRFGEVVNGCVGTYTVYNVEITGIPQVDVSVKWPDNLDTMVFISCDTTRVPLVFSNQGVSTIDSVLLRYSIDNKEFDSILYVGSYASSVENNVTMVNEMLKPGIHTITVIADVKEDSIQSNDTISTSFAVRFCGGEYIVDADSTGDYPSLVDAIDALNEVGMTGPISIKVKDGVYDGAIYMKDVYGSSAENTITIEGTGDSAVVVAATTADNNYVMLLDEVSHVNLKNLKMISRPLASNTTRANVLMIKNSSHLTVDSSLIRVKGAIVDTGASNIVLRGNCSNITIMNSILDSGAYAVTGTSLPVRNKAIRIENNQLTNFAQGGIRLRGVEKLVIKANDIISQNSGSARGLIGVFVANTSDTMRIEKNHIYMVDNNTSAKRGVHVERISSSMLNPAYIVNNMISVRGTDVKGLTPGRAAGIWVDSISSYVNVVFNTVQVYATNLRNATANIISYAFFAGSSVDHLQVMNNIFSNPSYGYAYYVKEKGTIVSSNFNGYYSLSPIPFAWKTDTISSLSKLQEENADDGNSIFDEPFFVSNEDLHILKANFAEKGQYNGEVIDDIDGTLRQQMPAPTIGAHEIMRSMHDLAIVRVTEPRLPGSTTTPYNIETDSVRVIATISNNGLLTENNVKWYAYVDGYEAQTKSAEKNAGTFVPLASKTDTLMMPTVVGIYDYQKVRVVVISSEDDTATFNNEQEAPIYLSPAFNIATKKVTYNGGCNLVNVPISVQIRNEGQKTIPSGASLKFGYHAVVASPSNLTISTMADTVEEVVTLTSPLTVGSTYDYLFSRNANLYPTDTAINITVRVFGWCKYVNDVLTANDTTPFSGATVKDSYYTPDPPFGHDTTFDYGSWGELIAEQSNNRPIRWYRDTTGTPFYGPSTYYASTKWGPTPQYFDDSTYYLTCVSDKGCLSKFSTLTVSVAPRQTRDVAVETMVAPLGSRVLMENDTVKVIVANYGTAAQGSIPITFELRRNSTLLQTVTENIASLAAGQSVEYTFKELLDLPNPTSPQTFSVNVYTDLTNDGCRKNDTLRSLYYFSTLSQDRYSTFDEYPEYSPSTKFDITSVSFSDIDLTMPALDRVYTNLADYNSIDYPVLHVRRGMTDTLFLEVSPVNPNDLRFRCRASVYIDFNRDGYFSNLDLDCREQIIVDDLFYSDSVFAAEISIPECAELGLMRMRVKVMGQSEESTQGHIIDFMLFVDKNIPEVDLSLTQIVSPHSPLVRTDDSVAVTFRMDNRGKNTIESADIFYRFYDDDFHYTGKPNIDTINLGDTVIFDTVSFDSTGVGVYHWTGSLAPGQSTLVKLPARPFFVGNTQLTIWHELSSDKARHNDTLSKEYHKFHVFTFSFEDDFEGNDYWYAPQGTSEYDRNLWQRGTPSKTRLKAAYSGTNAWVTDLTNAVVTGRRGNVSYLYSPIFYISSVKTDTIRFRMLRNITAGSTVHVEFLDSKNKWIKLNRDSITTWYNDEEARAFTGTTPSADNYSLYAISTTGKGAPAGFNEYAQFRFVYTAPMGTNSAAGYGDGCAVDDFVGVRARIEHDAGVVAIVHPSSPRFGETVSPKVLVRNFGFDTLKSYQVAYTYYGSPLPKISTINTYIPPDKTAEVECDQSFIVTSDFPDTFFMRAYTIITDDKYHDNDTSNTMVAIMPLDDDISAEAVLTPLEKAVAGDSTVEVTMRMQNFGFNDIHSVRAGYFVNGVHFTDEQIDFDSVLGEPLAPFEYYNYTFKQKMTPSLGVNNIKCYVKLTSDTLFTYEYNDTVDKRIMGMMSVTDLAAEGIQLDKTSRVGEVRVAVTIGNRGTTAANGFKVGFMIDDDTSTIVIETFNQAEPIKALSSGVHYFDYALLARPKPYDKVKAFVFIEDDNDRSNDTTEHFIEPDVDLNLIKLLVEENAAPTCRVYAQVRNDGNAPFYKKQFFFRAVINDSDTIIHGYTPEYLMPGETMHILFNTTIPKRSDRVYKGKGWVSKLPSDTNQHNDTTYIVERVNYVDGIDDVDMVTFSLEQNHPNPFTMHTIVPFTLGQPANVRFVLYDATGHTLISNEQFYQAGRHELDIDMRGRPSGIYYYGIDVNGMRKMKKMILK